MVHLNTRVLLLLKLEARRGTPPPPLIVYAKSAAVQSFYTDNRDEIAAADLQFSADICTISGWCTHIRPQAYTHTHAHSVI